MKLGMAMLMGFAAVPAAVAAPPLIAHDRVAADPELLNNANPAGFQVYGAGAAPRSIADETVEGGRALPVTVSGNGTPFAVGVNVPLTKPVRAGDAITIYYWAKLAAGGPETAPITAQLQLSAAPYTRIFGEGATIGREWKLFKISGTAASAYPRGTLTAAFHINTGAQTVVMGPVAVFAER